MIASYLTRNKQPGHGFQNTRYPAVRISIILTWKTFIGIYWEFSIWVLSSSGNAKGDIRGKMVRISNCQSSGKFQRLSPWFEILKNLLKLRESVHYKTNSLFRSAWHFRTKMLWEGFYNNFRGYSLRADSGYQNMTREHWDFTISPSYFKLNAIFEIARDF